MTVASGVVRQPRAWLNAGGGNINLESCRVTVGTKRQSHSFEAVMALDDPTNPGASFWTDSTELSASITATNGDGSGENTLISGKIYVVTIDFDSRTVSVEGNDPVTEMANQRNDQKYPNMTTADVVAAVAGSHGLSVQSDGGGDQAGRTYNNQDYAFNSDAESDWDVCQACADQDGKTCYVANNTLYYVDPGTAPGGTYPVTYVPPTPASYESGNFLKLRFIRDVALDAGVIGQVASWNTYDKKPYNVATGTN